MKIYIIKKVNYICLKETGTTSRMTSHSDIFHELEDAVKFIPSNKWQYQRFFEKHIEEYLENGYEIVYNGKHYGQLEYMRRDFPEYFV